MGRTHSLCTITVRSFFLIVSLFVCSCKPHGDDMTATTPAFDSVFVKAEHIYDAGYKNEALQLVLAAHSSIPDLTIADEINYLSYCDIIYGNRKEYDKRIAISDSLVLVLDKAAREGRNDNKQQIIKLYTVAYNNKADALFAKGMYNDAYDHYYKAQKLAKDNQDSCAQRSYAYSLAMVLYRQQRYAESAKSFIEAYNESRTCPEDFNIFYFRQEILDNIGLCYSALHKYDSAMHYYALAMDYLDSHTGEYKTKKQSVYEAPKAVVYGNMAEVYVNQGMYDTAKELYKRSISINLQKGYTNNDAIIDQAKLATLYFKTSDIPMMKKTLDDIQAELDTIPDKKVEMQWNKLMWQYEEYTHDSLSAYRHLRNYINQNEAYLASNRSLMTTDLDSRVKDIEKQYRINLLIKDKQQQRVYLIVLAIVALMALIIILLVWRDADRSRRNIRLLTKLNDTVNQQKQQLELALEEVRTRDKDRSRILRSVAHDVMNPIAAILSLADILTQESDSYSEAQLEIMNLIKEACNNSLSLSRDILEAAVEMDHTNIDKEYTDIGRLVARSVELLNFQALSKKQHITVITDGEVHAYVYKEKLWRVINNLIANAIKFSYEHSEIVVTLKVVDSDVHLSVKDNGVGIPEKNKPYIFDMFTEARMPGTSGEVPHGLGLSISQHIAKVHNGNISFESAEGKGSTFHLVFPVQSEGTA